MKYPLNYLHKEVSHELHLLADNSPTSIRNVVCYILETSGKRIRSSVMAIAAGLNDFRFDHTIKLAVAQELIHNASVLHDDVIDKASIRRGKTTVNQKFGSKTSILVGDWMFTKAMSIALELKNLNVVQILTEQIRNLTEGELLQEKYLFDTTVDKENILQIMALKTGSLFTGCFQLTANRKSQLSYKDQSMIGNKIGLAFQAVDDLLDIIGESNFGKQRFQDFTQGKITLPIYFSMQESIEMRSFIHRSFKMESDLRENIHQFQKIFNETKASEQTLNFVKTQNNKVIKLIEHLNEGIYKECLVELVKINLNRKL